MSPTIFRHGEFRFLFFSREEERVHVHVMGTTGEAKFWLDPKVELAVNHGLSTGEIREITAIIEGKRREIEDAWREHFGR
ncbi:MAG TPA: DUF4160 domain-containing protein [Candidatus Latescibacteria bacterium]|nr:DUF4160 domain-containing protein [Candidatus Latescibacterota bacterium]HOF61889.1 DUF4160 domain-containing protein [Candidatus Latescibacterota bacterium]HOS65958.1 DUF4160 domain-containing protein [Candidatus Latescibacterota bacterium]HOT37087.1 DUF4160 domain-containing protein [Candidatus Latescibacterota bacterium]HPC46037.1 DUF4160 domain-containing protein [Candidatus Latescibacterota bacterium]